MDENPRRPRVDSDGVRAFDGGARRRGAIGRLLVTTLVTGAAVVIALSALAVLFVRRDAGGEAPKEERPAAVALPRVASAAATPVLRRVAPDVPRAPDDAAPARRSTPAARPAGSEHAAAGPAASAKPAAQRGAASEDEERRQMERMAEDYVDALRASGETRGLAAFPPKGTDPIKTGLVVPEGFELPEGYLRHYQTTDDGQRLEAILMFSPDYQLVDADGRPIPMPKDGIVPPDMAPPGMPLRTLELPKARPDSDDGAR